MVETPIAGVFNGLGGTRLYFEEWSPERRPEAALVFAHGANNHCSLDAIQRLGAAARQAGLVFYAYDARGFGRSEGRPMHIDSFAQPRGDLAALLRLVRKRQPATPVFLAGCSYGALTALDQAIVSPHLMAGVIAMSFSTVGLSGSTAVAVKLISALGALFPKLTVPAQPAESFAGARRWLGATGRLWADPLCPATNTLGFVREVLARRGPQLAQQLPLLRVPLLYQAGALDDVAPPDPGLTARTGSPDATYRCYPDSGHDLLAEPDHPAVTADLLAWISERTSR
ncbi:MAG: lysophospholipase [Propionibacteriaceae bacterium]|jgi:lysophospholipase|nr:lysophospholipase [Propionibacteriaceae bacterium]